MNGRGRETLKRAVMAAAVLWALLPMLIIGITCAALMISELVPKEPVYDDFGDEEAILEVALQRENGGGQAEGRYCVLAAGGRVRQAEPFTPEPMTVYAVPHPEKAWFALESGEKRSFLSLGLEDEAGNAVPLTADLEAILLALDEIEHVQITVRVLDVGGQLFVYSEWNVNLWDPCVLYAYSPENQRLTKLCTWDGWEVTGLRRREEGGERSL